MVHSTSQIEATHNEGWPRRLFKLSRGSARRSLSSSSLPQQRNHKDSPSHPSTQHQRQQRRNTSSFSLQGEDAIGLRRKIRDSMEFNSSDFAHQTPFFDSTETFNSSGTSTTIDETTSSSIAEESSSVLEDDLIFQESSLGELSRVGGKSGSFKSNSNATATPTTVESQHGKKTVSSSLSSSSSVEVVPNSALSCSLSDSHRVSRVRFDQVTVHYHAFALATPDVIPIHQRTGDGPFLMLGEYLDSQEYASTDDYSRHCMARRNTSIHWRPSKTPSSHLVSENINHSRSSSSLKPPTTKCHSNNGNKPKKLLPLRVYARERVLQKCGVSIKDMDASVFEFNRLRLEDPQIGKKKKGWSLL